MKFLPSRLRRGSVLIIAMLVAALIALVLGSYLSLGLSTARFANRTFYSNASFNLAEAGAEEAVWSFNRITNGASDGWTAWSNDGTNAWQKFNGFSFGASATGSVKVYVENYLPPAGSVILPKVIALASVNSGADAPVTKMLELTLGRRSHFASGLVAQDSITFNGNNASVDSWNSGSAASPVPYSAAVRNDHGSVASASVQNTAMLVNQADIWGYAATGGAAPQVGVNGSIRGATTPVGVQIDPNRVSTDFCINLDSVTAPTGGTSIDPISGTMTLGTLGTATSWQCHSISLQGKQVLTILGQVTLVLTASSGSQALDIEGNATIHIPAGSSLTLYAEGDLKISGNGLGNDNVQPITCQFWGTNTTAAGQSIELAGNGALASVIYAPNAVVKLDGNGDMMGSVIAYDIIIVGNAAYHYDESLASYGDGSYGVTKWREITTGAERGSYLPLFNGW
jgi:Tfp pilus assembly protein PilX